MNSILKNKPVAIVIAVLVLAITVLAYANYNSLTLGAEAAKNGSLLIISDNMQVKLELEDIHSIPSKEFTAIQDTSSSGPEKQSFKGAELIEVIRLAYADLAKDSFDKIIVKGIDGYTVALAAEEIKSADNVFIAYEKNGKPLGSKLNGGSGPYQLIIRSDQFSQRWCKFVAEVILQ